MAAQSSMSPLLLIPRELRDEILQYIARRGHVYTSTSTPSTQNLHLSNKSEKTFVDTRVYISFHFPANILATCRQLRKECLELHHHLLNSILPPASKVPNERPQSNILAARLGNEIDEEAERAHDDGSLRITIEVQRTQRGLMGYSIPVREELSPRFMGLLPLMNKARKLRLVIWPGYDWWNGGVVQPLRRINKPTPTANTENLNAASIAIEKILQHLPAVEELSIDVLMHASEGSRWDLPPSPWEKVQPWLDSPVRVNSGPQLTKVVRRLFGVYIVSKPEAFYTQIEIRQADGTTWEVKRKGDMRTPTLIAFCDPEDMEYHGRGTVDECFNRTD